MSSHEELAAKDAIRELMSRYCFLMDAGQFDEWATLFTDEAVFVPSPDEICNGREAIRSYIGRVLGEDGGGVPRKHLTINPVITVNGDSAEGMSNVVVLMGSETGANIALAGRYSDKFVRTGAEWSIHRREVFFDIVGDLGLNS